MDAEQAQDNPVAAPDYVLEVELEGDLEQALEQYTAATSAEAALALRAVLDAVDRTDTAQPTGKKPAESQPALRGSENVRAVFARLGSAPTK